MTLPRAILFCLLACNALPVVAAPLPSWNAGPTRTAIIQFVEAVTHKGSTNFVPPAERIAVFDNDGTLWCEQPIYTQCLFGIASVQKAAGAHPDWQNQEPFKAALTCDLEGVVAAGVPGITQLTAGAYDGQAVEAFDQAASQWLATAQHPRFHHLYTECVYQPMLELLAYLRAHGFKTYIVTGGELDFVRPWAERVYGVPPEQVIGSAVRTRLEVRQGVPVLLRTPDLERLVDRDQKALAIQRVVGRRPIAAFGNSDGDLPMLQWTAAGTGLRFCLYVHHTDAEREYAYDRTAKVGHLDKGLDEAAQHGWTVVDMKHDWKRVFPFEKK
jgi:phosphoserine phosphatase